MNYSANKGSLIYWSLREDGDHDEGHDALFFASSLEPLSMPVDEKEKEKVKACVWPEQGGDGGRGRVVQMGCYNLPSAHVCCCNTVAAVVAVH
jgi:hypothetical protein